MAIKIQAIFALILTIIFSIVYSALMFFDFNDLKNQLNDSESFQLVNCSRILSERHSGRNSNTRFYCILNDSSKIELQEILCDELPCIDEDSTVLIHKNLQKGSQFFGF